MAQSWDTSPRRTNHKRSRPRFHWITEVQNAAGLGVSVPLGVRKRASSQSPSLRSPRTCEAHAKVGSGRQIRVFDVSLSNVTHPVDGRQWWRQHLKSRRQQCLLFIWTDLPIGIGSAAGTNKRQLAVLRLHIYRSKGADGLVESEALLFIYFAFSSIFGL